MPFVTVRLPGVERESINGEEPLDVRTSSVGDAGARRPRSADRRELNHVVLGEQVVKGNPLGAPATWAGEMAFLGNVIETKPDDHGVERQGACCPRPSRPRSPASCADG